MKILLLCTALVLGICCNAKELKVLMVGNSFSQSVLAYLPRIVKADPENKLILGQCMIGGCTLERHCKEYKKSAEDPTYRPYSTNLKFPDRKTRKASLQELLDAQKWDIISVQQGSHMSWKPESFKFADELIGYIRKHNPQAEIVVHQTWAYRLDDPRITTADKGWKIGQKGMYDRLTENYTNLAKKYNARIIPVGYAVQLTREKSPVKFKMYDPEKLKELKPPELPEQDGDVVGNIYWRKDKKTGETKLRKDTIHLNRDGNYLQACVWYMFLFDKKASDVKFVPKKLKFDAKFLADCAEEAVAKFPQVKK